MFPRLFHRPLARELATVIVVKIIVITLAAVFLFGARQRPHIDPTAVFDHLFK